ncbi:MAG: amino acid adenylation domain-containing protein [Blautia sp.]|nr:amino acid adenylation domain-containing protein [Blautia sp.]
MAKLVTDYLEETVLRFPEKTAYADESHEITFRQLRDASFHVASCLVRKEIFRRPVVVYMEKCVECIASFLGAAYSGNFYTPIDTTMPATRVGKILDTLQPEAVVTDREHLEKARELFPGRNLFLYEEMQDGEAEEQLVLETASRVIDTDILYILFTSGSTGTPKGVIISHRSATDYTDWITSRFDFNEKTIIGNQAPLYFDLSIQDVYAPICCGCTTQLVPGSLFAAPKKLMEYLVEKNVNTIIWVPTALCLMANMKALTLENLPKLEKVLFCGEVMPNKQLNIRRKAYPETVFVNLYGPTEACDACSYYIVNREFADDESLPIGKPCENTDILVLNSEDRLVGADEVGELCIRGSSLAGGYYHDPEKTAAAFTQNPLNPWYPELIYRTGDLVKYNSYGELEYVSRKDFQIKHLGYRIELGEIETVISSIPGVDLNCCLYDTKKKRIVLFYTGTVEKKELMAKAASMLPEYMLPTKYNPLEEMPRNLNGKIDRQALKERI